jgi:hypothetical protein
MKKSLLCMILCMSNINAMQRGRVSDERRAQLQEQLEGSAFRRGISTGIQGSMKIAPSDHSPISVKFDDISIVSWNLLSDEHTWNFLFDVGRKQYFADFKVDGKSIQWRDVFNNFGNFVINNNAADDSGIYKINITEELMNAFIADKKSKNQDTKNAQAFVGLVLDRGNPYHEDIKTSLMHVLEIKIGIEKGYLRWPDRFKLIAQNKFLVKNLVAQDFLCFQECTNPKDMLDLINSQKNFEMLEYKVKAHSKDNCVIIYDKNKYKLIKHHNFGLARNTKPCIVAQFRSLKTNESLIVGSIHHPGTGNSEMSEILREINHLAQGNGNIPVMVLGDYNHQSNFYQQDLVNTNFELKMPNKPTMAGFEYGNLNKAIDGVLTNRPAETTVNVLEQRTFASQVTLPMEIKFEI